MSDVTRRTLLKLAGAGVTAAMLPTAVNQAQTAPGQQASVPRWGRLELSFPGPSEGNPFVDVQIAAIFTLGHRDVRVEGFYDGAGQYKLRFMPDTLGVWTYRTESNRPALAGKTGRFEVVMPPAGDHGLVAVQHEFHFAHADGTPFHPFGTTCYAWIHQSEALQQETLATLRSSPFNKLRMCVFPKHYEYNHNEPALYPFERDAAGKSDFSRFNPAFFAHLEQRVSDLQAIGVQADLIIFHPYDRWGYASMPAEADDRYLRYLLARLSSHANVWWSLANEFDLMKAKTVQDFDRFFRIVEQYDPYAHLRSVHYSQVMYDYGRSWVTHASLQSYDFEKTPDLLKAWHKPICYDEVQYEGNLNKRWGNVSGDELARRFWLGVINGCYVTHGETYLTVEASFNEDITPTLWWSHGGQLHGTSPKQIAFLRKLLEESARRGDVHGLTPQEKPYYLNASVLDRSSGKVQVILYYFDFHQPIWYEFPLPDGSFTAELIDPHAETITKIEGTWTGKAKIKLSGKPYGSLRFTRNL